MWVSLANPTPIISRTSRSQIGTPQSPAVGGQRSTFVSSNQHLKPSFSGGVYFGRNIGYFPSKTERAQVIMGLSGFKAYSNVLGASYLPTRKVQKAIFNLITQDKPLSEDIMGELARSKARINNMYALFKNTPQSIKSPEDFLKDTQTFVQQLTDQIKDAQGVFRNNLGLQEDALELFNIMVSQTASTLFVLGFTDAIPHSAAVARLAVSKAKEQGANRHERLQAAFLWLHDPKARGDVSWDNLATHPVVASALAESVFDQKDFKKAFKKYVHDNGVSGENFKKGILEALSINNDSSFVLKRVILPGLCKDIQQKYGSEITDELQKVAIERLESASKNLLPPRLSRRIVGALHGKTLGTGITGIQKNLWDAACMAQNQSIKFDDFLNGKVKDPTVVTSLHKFLTTNEGFIECRPNAATMFSHHQEVGKCGKQAALALINSDPLMLSAHKVAISPFNKTLEAGIKSYIESFDENIEYLPQNFHYQGQVWQRAVYLALLKAADSLTGDQNANTFIDTHKTTSVETDVNDLRTLIQASETWGEYFPQANTPENTLFKTGLDAMETEYLGMCRRFRKAIFTNIASVNKIV